MLDPLAALELPSPETMGGIPVEVVKATLVPEVTATVAVVETPAGKETAGTEPEEAAWEADAVPAGTEGEAEWEAAPLE